MPEPIGRAVAEHSAGRRRERADQVELAAGNQRAQRQDDGPGTTEPSTGTASSKAARNSVR